MKLNSLQDVFVEQLGDLRSAEEQLVKALPKMASAANSPELKEAFEHHLEQTRNHVQRIEEVVANVGLDVPTEHCKGMEGLIKEGDDIVSATGDPAAKDAALIAAAQRVEHYEIAGYGSARTFAQRLGKSDVARLLQETLDEEGATDKKLTQIAETTVNPKAAMA
jgi:ferritin-like metal-binding protein YciE